MPESYFRQQSGQMDYTPAVALDAGQIIQLADGRAAVAKLPIPANEKGSVFTEGILDVQAESATLFDEGDPVYFDIATRYAIGSPVAVGDLYLGTATQAKVDGTYFVKVDLNKTGGNAMNVPFVTRTVANLAHDDVAEHDVIQAAQNPNGLFIVALTAEIVEVPAGSSEDQMEVTIYDEDDNALFSVISTDGATDVIGDVLYGDWANKGKLIPAGKGAYVKVSQATVGTPAGIMNIRAIVAPTI